MTRWFPVILICTIFFLYGRTIDYKYVKLDDASLIVDNYEAGFIQHLSNIPQAFRQSCFDIPNHYTDKKSYYRPLLILSFMMDAQVNGALPGMFHFMNIIYHILATLLLYFFLRRLQCGPPVAFALSFLFAIHPADVHAIAWVPGRNDMILAIFALLSFNALWDYYKDNKRRNLVIHLLAFTLALFSKESGVILLPLYFLFMWLWQRDLAFYRRKPFIILGYLGIITIWFFLRRSAMADTNEISRAGNVFSVLVQNMNYFALYIGKVLLPMNLNVTPGSNREAIGLGILSAGGVVFLLSKVKDRRKVIFGVCWFFLFLAPTLLVPDSPAYEHREYLPLIGLLLPLSQASFFKDFSFGAGKVTYALLGIYAVLITITYTRVPVYENAFTFWKDATGNTPFEATGDVNLGKIYQEEYEQTHSPLALEKATDYYRKALDVDSTVKLANNNYGAVLYFKGQKDLAAQYFMKEIKLYPHNADPYQNMGVYYRDKGQPDKAVPYWQQLIQMNQYYATAYEDLLRYYAHVHDTANEKLVSKRYAIIKAEMERRSPHRDQ